MTKITVELQKNDIMDLILLILDKKLELIEDSYDSIDWEKYFYYSEIEDKLVQ